LKLTNASSPQMREAEAAGAIHPQRSDSGWRMFGEEDVRRMIEWKARRRPPGRPARKSAR
jgi:hypothetical protein